VVAWEARERLRARGAVTCLHRSSTACAGLKFP
jgi:hypothetical protein